MSVTVNGNIAGGGVVGTVSTTSGGTGLTGYTSGDILYASATNTLSKLAKGSDGEVLTLASGVPDWAAAGGGAVDSVNGQTGVVVLDAADVGAAANSFTTIAVSGQSDVVADSTSDTLTLAAGAGITLTTDATTDTVTVAAPGWTSVVTSQSVGTGNTHDVTGIPTTARDIYIAFNGVSWNGSGAAAPVVQLIVSGSPVTSGYNSQIHTNSTVVAVTNGFPFFHNSTIASEAVVGTLRVFNYNSTTHEYMADGMSFTAVRNCDYEGQFTGAAQTTGIRLQAPGANTFDAGTVSVWYM